MFVLGGVCFVFFQVQARMLRWQDPMWRQVLRCAVFVTALEFITGIIVNKWLRLEVWDYTDMPFQILGQVCLPFPPYLSAVFPMVFTKNPFAHPDLQYRCNRCANIFKYSKHLSCIVRKMGLARHLDFLGFLSELNLFKRPCFALSFVSRPKANPSKAFQRLGKAAELAASSLDL